VLSYTNSEKADAASVITANRWQQIFGYLMLK